MVLYRYYKINNNLCFECVSPPQWMQEEFDWDEKGYPTPFEEWVGQERECIDYVMFNWILTKRIQERERELRYNKERIRNYGAAHFAISIMLRDKDTIDFCEKHGWDFKNGCMRQVQSGGNSGGDEGTERQD